MSAVIFLLWQATVRAGMRINDLMRVSHVKRWQIVRVGREQTLAEHLYRVWLLVREFGPKVGMTLEEQVSAENLALVHDLPEIKTGDIASPVKSRLPSLFGIEDSFCPQYAQARCNCTAKSRQLVKMCDLIEAAVFLEVEGIGRHANDIEAEILNKIVEIADSNKWSHILNDVHELLESQ